MTDPDRPTDEDTDDRDENDDPFAHLPAEFDPRTYDSPASLRDGTKIPYHEILVDPTAPPHEYRTVERRAVILKRIEQYGHPQAIPQSYSDLADEFGTTKSVIHNDMRTLAGFMSNHLTRDHYAIMDAVFRGAVQDLVKEGKFAWASEVGERWFEWLANMGAVPRAPDRQILDARVTHDSAETVYTIVDDDAADALVDVTPEQATTTDDDAADGGA